MNIIFFGSSEFSIPVLEGLTHSKHQVAHVVTTPDQKKGRGLKLGSSVVKQYAQANTLPFSTPDKLSEESVYSSLKKLDPELIVAASYGKLIPESIFKLAKRAALNVHPSLLPRHRGASPIQSAILEGDRKTGVSIAEIIKKLDAGDVYAQMDPEIDVNEKT